MSPDWTVWVTLTWLWPSPYDGPDQIKAYSLATRSRRHGAGPRAKRRGMMLGSPTRRPPPGWACRAPGSEAVLNRLVRHRTRRSCPACLGVRTRSGTSSKRTGITVFPKRSARAISPRTTSCGSSMRRFPEASRASRQPGPISASSTRDSVTATRIRPWNFSPDSMLSRSKKIRSGGKRLHSLRWRARA